jgi:uncharacterized protein YlxW (UPF0749 family)
MFPLNSKKSGWIVQLTILSLVLGALIAAALKTQQAVRIGSGIPTTRFPALAQALLDEKEKNKLLRKEITDLRSKLNEYEQSWGRETAQATLLSEELQKARMLAGLVPVEGPGLEVTLQDYPGKIPSDLPPIIRDQYLIHDMDIRDVINELFANGAEAISIRCGDSEQRVIAQTAIRCVGTSIQVNQVEMSSPFTIVAIGPPKTMEAGLRTRGGILDNWRLDLPEGGANLASRMVIIKRKEHLVVPAYSGNTSALFKWAKPVSTERKSEE